MVMWGCTRRVMAAEDAASSTTTDRLGTKYGIGNLGLGCGIWGCTPRMVMAEDAACSTTTDRLGNVGRNMGLGIWGLGIWGLEFGIGVRGLGKLGCGPPQPLPCWE